jgi:hypothetical protein
MAFPDCRPDFGVANLAFVLLFVGRELADNGDDTARRLDFEFLPALKTGHAASGRGHHEGFVVFDDDSHMSNGSFVL